ncbi:aldehyde dehydrogenase family protein [Stratiformator vulcanicus]|nr:aldehyde dehydrogenase family protein [Stratiformator vulcanicus]
MSTITAQRPNIDRRSHSDDPDEVAFVSEALTQARSSQSAWAEQPLREKLKIVRRFREQIAARPDDFTYAVELPQRRNRAETLASELLPLADACQFLESEAPRLLEPKKLSKRGRPGWLKGVIAEEHREPFGVVLIIATWNYPLLLPGVQMLQALVAGNAVLLKPGKGSHAAAVALREAVVACGLDPNLVTVLSEATSAAQTAITPPEGTSGADKVILTGAAATGRKVLAQTAEHLTPAAMELSGCDAVYVRGDADLDLVVDCLALGMTFNGSATCIAPRRVLVHNSICDELADRLSARFAELPSAAIEPTLAGRLSRLVDEACDDGATKLAGQVEGHVVAPILLRDASPEMALLQADIFAPLLSIVRVTGDEQALEFDRRCPYALGATIFSTDETAARSLAAQINAGCVVINDFLIPTADPRIAFGGRGESGFGVTRGGQGLIEMTQPKTVVVQRASWRPHLTPPDETYEQFFKNYIASAHAKSPWARAKAGFAFLSEAVKRQREQR